MPIQGLKTNEFDRMEQEINLGELFPGAEITEPFKLKFGQAVVDQIRNRTRKTQDNTGSGFAEGEYSDEYAESLDFKARGKSQNKVNMTLTGSMLRSLDVESVRGSDTIIITFDDNEEMAKATNHQYGNTVPERPFFGMDQGDLKDLANTFNVETTKTASDILESLKDVREIAQAFRGTIV